MFVVYKKRKINFNSVFQFNSVFCFQTKPQIIVFQLTFFTTFFFLTSNMSKDNEQQTWPDIWNAEPFDGWNSNIWNTKENKEGKKVCFFNIPIQIH